MLYFVPSIELLLVKQFPNHKHFFNYYKEKESVDVLISTTCGTENWLLFSTDFIPFALLFTHRPFSVIRANFHMYLCFSPDDKTPVILTASKCCSLKMRSNLSTDVVKYMQVMGFYAIWINLGETVSMNFAGNWNGYSNTCLSDQSAMCAICCVVRK